LQVVAHSPRTHTGSLGEQTRGLHVAVAPSQYSKLVQVAETVEVMPSSAQCRTVDPEQKSRPAEQASEAQAPRKQSLPVSGHDVPPAT
jgi:hypothetical protein